VTRPLLVSDSDVFAGTERHVADLARALRGQGVAVAVACPVPSPLASRAAGAGVRVVPLPPRDRTGGRTVRALAAALARGEADVVHAHNGRTALLAAIAVLLAGRGRCVATQHFLSPAHVGRRGAAGWASARAHRWVQGRTDHAIAISRAVALAMLGRGGAGADRVTVVPNGIADIAPAECRAPAEVRAELGVLADAPLVACVARLQPEKDVPLLVAAMERVVRGRPAARCVIVGDGGDRDAVRAEIGRRRLEAAVTMAGFRGDAPSVINAADLLVLPSRAEPFGLVLLEAMALAKPVVAMAAGGPPEVVEDGRTGRLCPPGDAGALADAIEGLLADPRRRAEMGQGGRRRFLDHFTADRMARATLDVYRRAAAGPG
jgi:glycosyltransferase involved in cell wall biosynthesis